MRPKRVLWKEILFLFLLFSVIGLVVLISYVRSRGSATAAYDECQGIEEELSRMVLAYRSVEDQFSSGLITAAEREEEREWLDFELDAIGARAEAIGCEVVE